MKAENVLRVIAMFLMSLFVCISIDFGMILASTRSSVEIANRLILNEKTDKQIIEENEVETNYSESVKRHSSDFMNLNVSAIENENFTPALYRWLWKNIPTQ